jgi:predicted AlkP superfamily pyrophosphatase or phosphodiesterase
MMWQSIARLVLLAAAAASGLACGHGGLRDRGHSAHPWHHARGAAAEPPKLVMQITVDQLRGDLPTRYLDRFGEGGFRYLLERGTHFTDAHYRHANTETAPGHATLATGADPARHGVVGNSWIDRQSGSFVYNTEDARHHVLGAEPKPHAGVSPENLQASTFGDELVLHTRERSRVFSVSGKDRGAILPGGHAGKAFWYSTSAAGFVTSTYYYDAYPAWVDAWNAAKPVERYAGTQWELLLDPEGYLFAGEDDQPWEASLPGFGRTFPHPFGEGRYLPMLINMSPMGDELLLDFAKALMTNEAVGQGDATDFLAISFSATDYVGHLFGPGSLESEDTILRLDRLLAELFAFIDANVGLDRTLIVLSADHGGVEAPEQAEAIGIEAGRMPLGFFRNPNPVSDALAERYGRDDLLEAHSHPYLYLDEAAVADAGLELADVEAFVAAEAARLPSIAHALTRQAIGEGLSDAELEDRVRRSDHPTRSGHVHLVQWPYWFMHSVDPSGSAGISQLATIHGSPWAYDTWVPILFAGPGVPAQKVSRRVGPHEIAPTLSAHLGVKPPSGSDGSLLVEVLPRH